METCELLVIGPHPDDPEFGAGGTAARLVKEGKKVVYVVCTNGDKGSDDPAMTQKKLAAIREKEQRAAAEVLGVSEVIFLNYPDQALEDTPEFRKELVRWIRTHRPTTVATSDPYRRYLWHRDHRVAGQAALDACFPYARDRLAYPDLLSEGIMPHRVKTVLLWGSEDNNYCSDISETWDLKVKALRCHVSQLAGRFEELMPRLRARHEAAGKDKGYALAEAFHRVEIPG